MRKGLMIRFFCPTCRAKVQAPDSNAGQSGWCPACKGAFTVPAASAAELAESISSLGNDIPAVPIPQSTRPASPFEVFGTGETPVQPPPPPPTTAQNAPPRASGPRVVDREEWEEPEEQPTQLPPPPQRPKVSTGWLPLALAGAGALLILITIIVGVIGRKTSQSVAVDSGGNPLPDPSKPKKGQIEIIPKSNAIPTT